MIADDDRRAAAGDDPVAVDARDRIAAAFPDALEETVLGGRHPFLRVKADRLFDVCRFLRDEAGYEGCHLVTGVDQGPEEGTIDVVYHLVSWSRRPDDAYRRRPEKNDPWLALVVRVPRDRPEVPSVASVWTGADWHERETYDLVGVVFTGRDDLRRILLPEDWPGHPLRKDWTFPPSYHGAPIIPPEAQP